MLVDSMLIAKELFDVLVVVQAAGLKFGAKRRINFRRHLMFNLMSNTDEKSKIVCCIAFNRARILFQAALKLPELVCPLCCAVETSLFSVLLIVTILGAELPEVSVKHVGPSNVHQDDEHLRFECDLRVIEDLNRS